jgi:hypothetical protein
MRMPADDPRAGPLAQAIRATSPTGAQPWPRSSRRARTSTPRSAVRTPSGRCTGRPAATTSRCSTRDPTCGRRAALGRADRLDRLLAAEPPPERDEVSNAFWCACHGGQRATAERLLERGADIDWIGHADSPRSTRPRAATPPRLPTGCAREAPTTPRRTERYDRNRARLTLERDDLQAQLDGACPRSCVGVTRAPDAGRSRRRRASATFPVL